MSIINTLIISSKIMKPFRDTLKKVFLNSNIILATRGIVLYLAYYNNDNIRILKLIKEIKNEKEMLLSDLEIYQIFNAVIAAQKIKGDIAEVGVYKGGSAKFICEIKKNKRLHLFDTFEGLPEISKNDDPFKFSSGQYIASLKSVQSYLKKYPRVYFYKGYFKKTFYKVMDKKFSFVHLDVDLYKSTIDCLKFFYPRMSKGGIIISHDYESLKGVKKAFNEFMEKKTEPILTLAGSTQCLVVKS